MSPIQPTLPSYHINKESGQHSVSFLVNFKDRGQQEVWFKASQGPLSRNSDFLLPICLVAAMKKNQASLDIPGRVSSLLTDNLVDIQNILKMWNDQFTLLKVTAETIAPAQSVITGKAASFYSGGVDSAYTLLKNIDKIDAIVFVHGFDISISNEGLRAEASKGVKDIARNFGKEYIEVETNIREFTDPYSSWRDHYHGPAMAAVALLLSAQFSKFFIPATHTYNDLFQSGSHPLLDPLWGTEALRIIHDGCESTRVEKIELIARNDVILRNLRVCWENRGGAFNCCECEKCIRTMINLKVIGALERCKTFDRPLDPKIVAKLKIKTGYIKVFVEQNLSAVEAKGDYPELAQALRQCLSNYGKHERNWRYYPSFLLSKFPLLRKLYNLFKTIANPKRKC